MIIDCKILLVPRKEGFYKSGDPVKGVLKFSLDKQNKFNSITLELVGKGKSSWSESDSDRTTQYTGKETYVRIQKKIMQPPQTHLEKGNHEYPFEYYLPEGIPSTFHDSICTIKYKIVAEFKKSGLFSDKTFDVEIPVYGNFKPCSTQPINIGLNKTPTGNSGVDMKVNIDKTFLTPGESIKVGLAVSVNNTGVAVSSVKAKLVSYMMYISDTGSKNAKKKTIKESKVKSSGCNVNSKADYNLTVPTFRNMYSIQCSKIVVRQYELEVKAKLPFPHRDALIRIPVVIGVRNN